MTHVPRTLRAQAQAGARPASSQPDKAARRTALAALLIPLAFGGTGLGGLGLAAYAAETGDAAAESKIVCADVERTARERIGKDVQVAAAQLRRDPTGSVFVNDDEFDACDGRIDFSEVAEDEMGR